jgi:tRNA(Ile)-lysidine synthase
MNDVPGFVRAAMEQLGLGRGRTVLAAISGGPDSTAMLRALAGLRERRGLSAGSAEDGFVLRACVVDHGIRSAAETAADVAFVQRLCGGLGIPLVVKTAPPGECARRARAAGAGMEEAARDLRYSLLAQAARETAADVIALGHTQDDVIETLLMRVLQGSDVHGLRGIPSRRGPFFRPLLGCPRAQVLEYLDGIRQDWREDLSNRDTAILRNRIRHRLLPVLEKEFPGYRRGLITLSRKLALSSDLARTLAASLPWRPSEGGFSLGAVEFFAAHPAVRAWSLLRLYDRIRPAGTARRRLPWRFLSPALRPGGPPRASTILQGHGVKLSAEQGTLTWGPDIATRSKKGYFIVVSEARSTEIREAGVRVCITRRPDARGGSRGGIVILAEKVKPPFVLRSKRRGDHIRLAGGTTSVKELLIAMKVPEPERDRIPILSDRSGVLAVLGGPLGYRTRARADILAPRDGAGDRIEIMVEGGREEGRE